MISLLEFRDGAEPDFRAAKRAEDAGHPLSNLIESALRELDDSDAGPFSVAIVPTYMSRSVELEKALNSIAAEVAIGDNEGSDALKGLLPRPFTIQQITICPYPGEDPWDIWFLTPYGVDPSSDPTLFPSENDLWRTRASRVVAYLPVGTGYTSESPEYVNRLKSMLEPWVSLQVDLADLMRESDMDNSVDSIANGYSGYEARAKAVSALMDRRSSDREEHLRTLYNHGRNLARLDTQIAQRVGAAKQAVQSARNFPDSPDGARDKWFSGCLSGSSSVRSTVLTARNELKQATQEATQLAIALNLAQTDSTKRLLAVASVIVFLIGLTGLYVDSFAAKPEVTNLGSNESRTALHVLIVVGAYGALIGLIWRLSSIRHKLSKGAQLAMLTTVFLAVIVSLQLERADLTVIFLALGGLVAAALIDPD